jgi:methyl-accepting chemotaxis protein
MVIGVCLFFCLLIVTAVGQFRETALLRDDAHLAFHAHEFVEALDDLLLTVKEAETGHTYYMMTGEDKYLKTYAAAIDSTKEKIESIKRLAANSVEERNRIPGLQTVLNSELNQLSADLASHQEKGFDAARMTVLASQETRAMDAFQAEVKAIERYEQDVLQIEEHASGNHYRWAVLTIVFSAALALTLWGAVVWLLRRHGTDQRKAAAKLHE